MLSVPTVIHGHDYRVRPLINGAFLECRMETATEHYICGWITGWIAQAANQQKERPDGALFRCASLRVS